MVMPLFNDDSDRVNVPIVNHALIAVNVFVFVVLQLCGTSERFTYMFSTVPHKIVTGDNTTTPPQDVEDPITGERFKLPGIARTPGGVYVTLLTSVFLHAGWAHLLGNMWFLWIFGDTVEDRLGRARYLLFYLLCGVLASLAHVAATEEFGQNDMLPALGASGAISGVLGAYVRLYPTKRVTVVVGLFLIEVPAYMAMGLWFIFQLISGLGALGDETKVGGVAYAAHVGGFVFGMALLPYFVMGRPPPQPRPPVCV
jgi:membrane associated rhomboid family serine protease